MLIGSNVSSDYRPLQGTPWNMEPTRPPPNTSTSIQSTSPMELSPTGQYNLFDLSHSKLVKLGLFDQCAKWNGHPLL